MHGQKGDTSRERHVRTTRPSYKPAMRRLFLQVHLWAGLIVGAVLSVVGVTGAMLVFLEPLTRSDYAHLAFPANQVPTPQWGAVDQWIAKSKAAYPDIEAVELIFAPGAAPVPAKVPVMVAPAHLQDGTEHHYLISINPVTNAPSGRAAIESSVTGLILFLHATLLVPVVGFDLVAWASVLMLISIGAGIYLWWPPAGKWRNAFLIKRGAKGRRLWLDVHNVTAVWLLLPLVTVILTGIYLSKAHWFDPTLDAVSGIRQPDFTTFSKPANTPGCRAATPGSALAAVLADHPGKIVRMIGLGEGGGAPIYIGLTTAGSDPRVLSTEVWVDQNCLSNRFARSGDDLSAAEWLKSQSRVFHADLGLGVVGAAMVFLTGIILPFLYVTGIVLWRKRVNGRKKRAQAT